MTHMTYGHLQPSVLGLTLTSGMRFAALHGVKYPSFANWVQGRRRRRAPEPLAAPVSRGSGADAVQWLEAEVGAWIGGEGCGGLMLHLPCGVRVELTHPHQVKLAAHLIQALTPQVSTTGPRPAPLPCWGAHRKGKNCTLRVEAAPERSKFVRFGFGKKRPEVISAQIDVFPAQR